MSKPNHPSGPEFGEPGAAIDVEAELELAFAELDSKIPDGVFETFSSKVAASLEAEASMQSPTSNISNPNTPNTPPPSVERDEHSGLHEIKALAQTARNRISRRQRSESDVEEAMLSSSSAALSAVVLPDPGSETAPPEPIEVVASPASPASFSQMPTPSAGVPTWLLAFGGTALIAAAAAAALFIFSRGGSSDDAAGDQIAAADKAEPPASAPAEDTPTPAPTVAALDEDDVKAAAEPADEPEPDTATEMAVNEEDADSSDSAADEKADTSAARGVIGGAAEGSSGSKARAKRTRSASAKDESPKRPETKKPEPEPEAKEPERKEAKGGGEATGDINDLLDQVAGTDAKKPAKAKPEEKKVDKKRLGSGDIRDAMRGVTGAVNACQKKTGFIGRISVKFSVSPSGKVGRVKASGGNGAVQSCVASAVKRASFPTFNPPSMSFRYSFLLSD